MSGDTARGERAAGTRRRLIHYASATLLFALFGLSAAWELWLAPLRPGGSWLALKMLPLLLALKGVARGDVYTFRWSIMLVLAYLAEGCVRAYAEEPPVSTLALIEIAIAAAFFVAAIAYVRATRG